MSRQSPLGFIVLILIIACVAHDVLNVLPAVVIVLATLFGVMRVLAWITRR